MNDAPYTPSTISTRGLDKSALKEVVLKPVEFELDGNQVALGIRTHTCPQCGLNPVNKDHKQKFQFVPPWVYIGLMLNLIVLLIMYYAGRKVIDTSIALCDPCAAQMKRARLMRGLSIFGAVFAPMILAGVGGAIQGAEAALALGGIGLVAGVVGSVVAHKRTTNDVLLVKEIKETKTMIDGKQTKKRTLRLRSNVQFQKTLRKEAPHLFKESDRPNPPDFTAGPA